MNVREVAFGQSEAHRVTSIMPSVFVSHGSPMVALDEGAYHKALEQFGASVDPESILVVSGHWEEPSNIRITAGKAPKLIYDFGGFPDSLFRLKYDAPGSPALASEVQAALGAVGTAATLDSERGWDHGVWIPLRLMFPQAQIPVVQISLPLASSPAQLFKLGGVLGQFRHKKVLILGSGGLVHNLGMFRPNLKDGPVDGWANEFENWVKDRIRMQDFTALFNYRRLAPSADRAVPTPEHFAPLFVVLGAAQPYSQVVSIFNGFQYGNISMHCFALE